MHPATKQILQHFDYKHLPEHLVNTSKPFHDLAHHIAETATESPEVTVGLRKLLEAKDCIVRSAL